jgi:hypothetical protein
MRSEIFDKRISNFCTVIVGDAHGGAFDFLHQSIEIIVRIRNADDANCGAVPQTAGIEFCNRNVEAGAQLVFQAAHHLTAIFEGLRGFDVKFEREKSDHEPEARG